jgi:uncharacterized protein (TIGR03086 family)
MAIPPDPEVQEIYRRCSAEFARRAHRVGDRWDATTPCPGWDVRELVRHLVEEERWAPPLFAGETMEQVGDRFAGDLLGADPIAALDDAAAAAVAAVSAESAPARTVHLSFGDHPGREYAMQLAADHLVHAWDLARALGQDEALDAGTVAVVLAWFRGMEDTYRKIGVIGPRAPVPADASPQDELLARFGRTP